LLKTDSGNKVNQVSISFSFDCTLLAATWSHSISYYYRHKSETLDLVWYVTFSMVCIHLWMSIIYFAWCVMNYNSYDMLRFCNW
jgi:hypothetical protein